MSTLVVTRPGSVSARLRAAHHEVKHRRTPRRNAPCAQQKRNHDSSIAYHSPWDVVPVVIRSHGAQKGGTRRGVDGLFRGDAVVAATETLACCGLSIGHTTRDVRRPQRCTRPPVSSGPVRVVLCRYQRNESAVTPGQYGGCSSGSADQVIPRPPPTAQTARTSSRSRPATTADPGEGEQTLPGGANVVRLVRRSTLSPRVGPAPRWGGRRRTGWQERRRRSQCQLDAPHVTAWCSWSVRSDGIADMCGLDPSSVAHRDKARVPTHARIAFPLSHIVGTGGFGRIDRG